MKGGLEMLIRRVLILCLLLCTISIQALGESPSLHLSPQGLEEALYHTYQTTHRQFIGPLGLREEISLGFPTGLTPLYDFTNYLLKEDQVLALTEKGFTLQNRFELMDGVALIGSYRMESSPLEEREEGILFSRIASGEINIDPQVFLNMGISIHLIQEDQDRLEGSGDWENQEWDALFTSYRNSDLLPGENASFWEERLYQDPVQRTGVALNIMPFDKTVVLADYILHKDTNDLSTRITSLGLEYEDERNRLLAKYELEASEDNRRATAMAGVEVGIKPWGSLLATFQWANQEFFQETMKESVLNLGLDIFLSDTTSLLLGYTYMGQDWIDIEDLLEGQKERSNVAGARLKFRF